MGSIPRGPLDSGGSDTRGISNDRICVVTGINDDGDTSYDVACRGAMTKDVFRSVLEEKLSEGSFITTGDYRAYPKVLSELNATAHNVYPADNHWGMEPMDHVHFGMKSLINHRAIGISAKWLYLYLAYFKWIGEFANGVAKQSSFAVKQICSGYYNHRWRDINLMSLPFSDPDLNTVNI